MSLDKCDLNHERTERRQTEKQLAWALKQNDIHGQKGIMTLRTKFEADRVKANAEIHMKNAKKIKESAQETAAVAESQVEEASARITQLENTLRERERELEDLNTHLEASKNQIRSECKRELLKQQAELERLKTMMDWKAKIVEDDVRFRTESEWRGRAKVLVSEVEDLKQALEREHQDKSAAQSALAAAEDRVAAQQIEINDLHQRVAALLQQQQAVEQIKGTVNRLRAATETQWRGAAIRDSATVQHLQKELEFFRSRKQELPSLANSVTLQENHGQRKLQNNVQEKSGKAAGYSMLHQRRRVRKS